MVSLKNGFLLLSSFIIFSYDNCQSDVPMHQDCCAHELRQEIHALDEKVSTILNQLNQLKIFIQTAIGTTLNADKNYQEMIKQGLQLLNENKSQEAEEIFLYVAQESTDSYCKAFSQFQLGLLAHQRNQYEQAQQYYEAALKHQFGNQIQTHIQFNLALLYEHNKDYPQAHTYYQHVIEQQHAPLLQTKAMLNNALIYHKTNNPMKAHYYYKQAYDQEIDQVVKVTAAYNHAQLYLKENKIKEACTLLSYTAQQTINAEIQSKSMHLLKKITRALEKSKKI